MKTIYATVATLALVILPNVGQGLGFRIADQDTEATARSNAFAATADNPSAIYYNPAGITQLDGFNSRAGVYGITIQSTYSPPAGQSGGSFTNIHHVLFVPDGFYTYGREDWPVSFGLGFYSPFGLSLQYPENSPFRNSAISGNLLYITANPVVAWKVTKQLSLAAGLTVDYSKVDLKEGIAVSGDEFHFKGDGQTVGFNLGAMWRPTEQHSFGLTYRSNTSVYYSGDTATTVEPLAAYGINQQFHLKQDADATIRFPQSITFGYSFRPTPDWNLEADIDWADWSCLKDVTLHQPSGNVVLPFNWKSSFMYEFAVTRNLPHDFHVSAGYMYSENSVPSGDFSPTVPDSNRDVFGVGIGQKCNHFSWDLAYQLAYGPSRGVDNSTVSDGYYRFLSNAISLSFGYKF